MIIKNQDVNDAPASPFIETKVSSDGGQTWERRGINFSVELEESGLKSGEIFQANGDKYEVVKADGELQVRKLGKQKRQR